MKINSMVLNSKKLIKTKKPYSELKKISYEKIFVLATMLISTLGCAQKKKLHLK